MKRNFLFKNQIIGYIFKWLTSFLISVLIMFVTIMLLSLLCTNVSVEENIIRVILFIIFTMSAGVCSYIFQRISHSKGYISGIVTGLIFSLSKLIMSLSCSTIGKGNIMIYISLISMALIGGILSANRSDKNKSGLVKINKINKFQ